MLWREQLDVAQSVRSGICFREVGQRFPQKILHGRFAVKQVHIRVVPFVSRAVQVRHMREKNRFPGQQPAYRRGRSLLRKPPDVPSGEREDRTHNDNYEDSAHLNTRINRENGSAQ